MTSLLFWDSIASTAAYSMVTNVSALFYLIGLFLGLGAVLNVPVSTRFLTLPKMSPLQRIIGGGLAVVILTVTYFSTRPLPEQSRPPAMVPSSHAAPASDTPAKSERVPRARRGRPNSTVKPAYRASASNIDPLPRPHVGRAENQIVNDCSFTGGVNNGTVNMSNCSINYPSP